MRATAVKRASTWTGDPADSIVLDYDDRYRRRVSMTCTHGLEFMLDLAEAIPLRNGDALVLEDGRLVEIVSAPEPLLEIRCADPLHLARVAWHLGNRHLPVQLLAKSIRIRRDHVIAEMVARLGARVADIEAPFDPEGGAYGEATVHHDHHHHQEHDDDDHSHGHRHGR